MYKTYAQVYAAASEEERRDSSFIGPGCVILFALIGDAIIVIVIAEKLL